MRALFALLTLLSLFACIQLFTVRAVCTTVRSVHSAHSVSSVHNCSHCSQRVHGCRNRDGAGPLGRLVSPRLTRGTGMNRNPGVGTTTLICIISWSTRFLSFCLGAEADANPRNRDSWGIAHNCVFWLVSKKVCVKTVVRPWFSNIADFHGRSVDSLVFTAQVFSLLVSRNTGDCC